VKDLPKAIAVGSLLDGRALIQAETGMERRRESGWKAVMKTGMGGD